MIFEGMLIERKFSDIYKAYFSFNYISAMTFEGKKRTWKERYLKDYPCPSYTYVPKVNK